MNNRRDSGTEEQSPLKEKWLVRFQLQSSQLVTKVLDSFARGMCEDFTRVQNSTLHSGGLPPRLDMSGPFASHPGNLLVIGSCQVTLSFILLSQFLKVVFRLSIFFTLSLLNTILVLLF